MTLKRLLMPLLVVGIIVSVSSVASAQTTAVVCSLVITAGNNTNGAPALPGPTANSPNTGHTEPIGAGPRGVPNPGNVFVAGGGTLRIACTNPTGAAIDPGVSILQINFGIPITNTTTHPNAAAGIRVANGTGAFITGGAGANVGISSVSNSGGNVVIGLGTPQATSTVNPTVGITFPANSTSTFDLMGVLLSVNGRSGDQLATMVDIAGAVTMGTNTVVVITNVSAGLQDPTVPTSGLPAGATGAPNCPGGTGCTGGAAVLNANGVALKGNFTIRIQENNPNVFKESGLSTGGDGFNGGGVFPVSPSSDVSVNIRYSGVPAGLNISNCNAIITDVSGNPSIGAPTVTTSVTSTAPVQTVNFSAQPDQSAIDVVWVTCATVGIGTAAPPLPTTPVTVQIELGPEGAALSGIGGALTGLATGLIPRYQQAYQPSAGIPVIIFPPAHTTLLLSFAFVGPGYNTGIAISNTTRDSFTPGGGGAAASSGTVRFLMVKNDGTTREYETTTNSPGGGLSGAGVVASGSTYVVNLSELLSAASFGSTFSGYVFITANFTHAHGAATIYTTSTGAAALSSPVLVLPAVSTAATRGSPESLGQ
jgi:hypothetical protein